MQVITFFFLQLGATVMDIGYLSFFMGTACMILSPFYGWMVDSRGILKPLLLSVLSCGLGCLIRAMASSSIHLVAAQIFMGVGGSCQWSMVKGYIASELPHSKRALLVVGLRAQMTLLTLGSFLYPLLDSGLQLIGFQDKLLRYRAEVGTCAIFCWIGIVVLLAGCSHAFKQAEPARQRTQLGKLPGPSTRCSGDFIWAALTLGMVSCCQSVCRTLWPIYIKFHFGWEARPFAFLSSSNTLLFSLALAMYPSWAQRIPQRRVLQSLAWLSFLFLVGFGVGARQPSLGPQLLHVVFSVPCLVFIGVLTSGVEVAASLCVPADAQGWAMGFLNSAQAGGAVAGSLLGPALWTFSTSDISGRAGLLSEGRLPFIVTAASLLLCVSLLQLPLWERPQPAGSGDSNYIDMVPIGCGEERSLADEDPANLKGCSQANDDENLPLNEDNSKVY